MFKKTKTVDSAISRLSQIIEEFREVKENYLAEEEKQTRIVDAALDKSAECSVEAARADKILNNLTKLLG